MPATPGTWTEAHVRRLFWRAGFGATPAEAKAFAARGKAATINWLLNGGPGPKLQGPPPKVDGKPLDPNNEWGHDVLWWLDRMVRSQRPLVEKMTLFWHDHFATSDQETPLMLRQNKMFRRRALGDFRALLTAVTKDPAMQLFLSLADSTKEAPNENYARELMELFTLGRGYTERDVREAARALTGFHSRWDGDRFGGIGYDREAHDPGVKRIFHRRGRFDWRDVVKLVTHHRAHAPFIVGKLWSFFVTAPLDRHTRASLVRVYRRSKLRIKPVVGAILSHPALYASLDRPDMVKCPVVYLAGGLRAAGRAIDTSDWAWILEQMGQYPFDPPSVAGWDWGPAWLSTNTMRARFTFATYMVRDAPLDFKEESIPVSLTPAQQVARARSAVGEPWVSSEAATELQRMAGRFMRDLEWEGELPRRADQAQRTLRHFLISGPDAQLH